MAEKPDNRTFTARRKAANQAAMREMLQGMGLIGKLTAIGNTVSSPQCDPQRIPGLRLKAEIMLRMLNKILPDLRSVELSGEVTQHHTHDELELARQRATQRALPPPPSDEPRQSAH